MGEADADERYALSLAAHANRVDVVQFLLKKQAIVDAPDLEGNTALILAAAQNNRFCVEHLLAAWPKVDWRNAEHKRAVDVTTSIPIKRMLERQNVRMKMPHAKDAVAHEVAMAKKEDDVEVMLFRFRLEHLA